MAIEISGSTIIDDSRNIINAGIITASSFSGDGSNLTGVGIGTDDSINTSGIITASVVSANEFIGTGDELIFSPTVTSFSPTDGATDVSVDTNIVLTFDQPIYAGSGSVFLRNSSSTGTVIEEIGISSSMINNQTLTINPSSNLPYETDVYVVLPQGVIKNSVGGNNALLDTYNFTTPPPPELGDPYGGGYLICQASSVQWIVAPASTEVSRNWHCRNDAVTTAQASAACGDWFVPTCGQLQNPGYVCRTYWDSYSSEYYWSSTEWNNDNAWNVCFTSGFTRCSGKTSTFCVRAFRCVSY
jgi:hypothetical protein